ncbi:conserved Plasmodium protein, unknown function [Plasmodium malariae]|uniref:RAP domain-containing protein n=1 Tax=Plasmodium malariae TaxID=5858 RepID=A0A1A8WBW8_PLAMA|nr:conserved Plasmodium protein, unknown function [Plasmodium malariae]
MFKILLIMLPLVLLIHIRLVHNNERTFVGLKNNRTYEHVHSKKKKHSVLFHIRNVHFSGSICNELNKNCGGNNWLGANANNMGKVHRKRIALGCHLNGSNLEDTYNKKIYNSLMLLKNNRNRDCEKLKLIYKYIFHNLSSYNSHEITNILYCTYFFSIILKKEDLYRLIKRLKLLTFNNNRKEDNIYNLFLNLLRIKIPKENADKKIIFILNNFINDLSHNLLLYDNQSKNFLNYIYYIKEIQLIYNHDLCSWIDKKYLDNSCLNFLQSFQNSIVRHNRNLDYVFINEVIDILYELNCQISEIKMYNYTIPIFIKDLNLIIECISMKNTFDGTLIVIPYFLQRYKLFKKLNFKVLLLYKQLVPQRVEEKVEYVKKAIYDIIK